MTDTATDAVSDPRSRFRHLEPLRVRWAEVDLQRIVFNGHYLMYFDTAVAGWWRAMALPYQETMVAFEGDLYVRKATVEYEGSARYDDLCEVGIRCARIGNSSMTVECALLRDGRRLVHGELLYVFADPATQTSRPVPPGLRALIDAFEAGEPMFRVALEPWSDAAAAVRALRQAVFVEGQGLPAALVEDAADAGATLAVARNRLGLVVAAGRLTAEAAHAGVVRLSRVAVHPLLRGGGLGRAVVAALADAARARGARQMVLDAASAAVPFWTRCGFEAVGETFAELGMPHRSMRRAP